MTDEPRDRVGQLQGTRGRCHVAFGVAPRPLALTAYLSFSMSTGQVVRCTLAYASNCFLCAFRIHARSFVRCKLLLRPFSRKAGKIPLSETSIEFHRSQQSPPILPMSYYYLCMIIESSKRVEY